MHGYAACQQPPGRPSASGIRQAGQAQAIAKAVELRARHRVAVAQVVLRRPGAALLESPQVRPADPLCAGLAHVALRIGDDIETLRAFHAHLRDLGVALHHSRDHEVSQSLYLRDPDGLLVEAYVDADPALWASRPEAVATVRPLRVDWLN